MKAGISVAGLTILLSACALPQFSHTNVEIGDQPIEASRATLHVTPERGRDDALVVLALSGGGSRAAYWSASVMLRLQTVFADLDILCEVDAISSVSGGSLPAAYYGISVDTEAPCPGSRLYKGHGRKWDEETVKELMTKNYINRWFGNWYWPTNIAKFWLTSFDRTDIMAQTFADNLYDSRPAGQDLKIGDLLPNRPYLILNATNGTSDAFGELFTFTAEDFSSINSDINDYDLARAVMSTATFPAVFNYMTLKSFNKGNYVHIFDGGNADNLGLSGVCRMFDAMEQRIPADKSDKSPCTNSTPQPASARSAKGIPQRVIVILVDAYTGKSGVDSSVRDSRRFSDFIVDSNFLDASDSLLSANRKQTLRHFRERFAELYREDEKRKHHMVFYHLKFADIKDDVLREGVDNIPTNFKIAALGARSIDAAVDRLLTPDNTCLAAIKAILSGGSYNGDPLCAYAN